MKIIMLLLLFVPLAWAEVMENHAPVVENVRFFQRTDGTLLVDVYYDVLDVDNDSLEISMQVSGDEGLTWTARCPSLSGDIGLKVVPGRGKHIVWDFFVDNPQMAGNFRIRVTAEDQKYRNMVLVAAGEFTMGSEGGFDEEKPAHKVYLDAFYIDKYEVTNAQYAVFLNVYGSDKIKNGVYAGKAMIGESAWGVTKASGTWQAVAGYENHPVVNVTWFGADEYARFYGKRLPTEAEWEKAARGGNASLAFLFSGGDDPSLVGWYANNSGISPHAVGQKQANSLGISDMTGNVWEWCADWYNAAYYSVSPAHNPQGPATALTRVLRGGSWDSVEWHCRVSKRWDSVPETGFYSYGFRCAQNK